MSLFFVVHGWTPSGRASYRCMYSLFLWRMLGNIPTPTNCLQRAAAVLTPQSSSECSINNVDSPSWNFSFCFLKMQIKKCFYETQMLCLLHKAFARIKWNNRCENICDCELEGEEIPGWGKRPLDLRCVAVCLTLYFSLWGIFVSNHI